MSLWTEFRDTTLNSAGLGSGSAAAGTVGSAIESILSSPPQETAAAAPNGIPAQVAAYTNSPGFFAKLGIPALVIGAIALLFIFKKKG